MMKKGRCKKNGTDIIFNVIAYTLFTLLGFLFAYPFYYLFICTISENRLVNLNDVILYPKGIHFQNYVDVLKLGRMQSAAIVSVARTLLGTVMSVLFVSYTAYFFTKESMWPENYGIVYVCPPCILVPVWFLYILILSFWD